VKKKLKYCIKKKRWSEGEKKKERRPRKVWGKRPATDVHAPVRSGPSINIQESKHEGKEHQERKKKKKRPHEMKGKKGGISKPRFRSLIWGKTAQEFSRKQTRRQKGMRVFGRGLRGKKYNKEPALLKGNPTKKKNKSGRRGSRSEIGSKTKKGHGKKPDQ